MSNNMNTSSATNDGTGGQPPAQATVVQPVPLYVPPHRRAELQASVPIPDAPGQNLVADAQGLYYFQPSPAAPSPLADPGVSTAFWSVPTAPYYAPFPANQSAPLATPQDPFSLPTFGTIMVSAAPYYAPFTMQQSAPQVPFARPGFCAIVPAAPYDYDPFTPGQPSLQLTPQQAHGYEYLDASAPGGYFVFAWPQSAMADNTRLPDASASALDATNKYICWKPCCMDCVQEAENMEQRDMRATHGMQF